MCEEKNNNDKANLDWHSAFEGGLRLCLRKYESVLSITREHSLSRQPLRIDFLVVKKIKDVAIGTDIGKLFLNHNIIEYKNPDDNLDIDVLWKVIGYAGIYKSLGKTVNEIPAGEMTISIFRMRKPRDLFSALVAEGYSISREAAGIYRICGVVSIPVYIVVMKELADKELNTLRIITSNADAGMVKDFVLEASSYVRPSDKRYADMVMQIVATANSELVAAMKGDESMCEALREIMADELNEAEKKGEIRGEIRGEKRGERKGEIKTLVEMITRKLAKGKTLEDIADELEKDVEKIRPIVMLASKYAPDYDIDAIYNALNGDNK